MGKNFIGFRPQDYLKSCIKGNKRRQINGDIRHRPGTVFLPGKITFNRPFYGVILR
jgi:hypothetical protein